MGSTLAACGDVNRNVMGPAAPFKDKPEYMLAQQYANDIADLLAPQSGAYYDVWLDGEKFMSVYKEVSWGRMRSSGVCMQSFQRCKQGPRVEIDAASLAHRLVPCLLWPICILARG